MPCLNEEKTLGRCMDKAKAYLERAGLAGEILVADNGSTDRSVESARQKGGRVVEIAEKGYGCALRGGVEVAEYEYIVMGDADDSYDFSDLSGFIQKLDEGFELVMGNRFKGGIEKGAMPFSHQYIGNPLLSGLGRCFFGAEISDFHCGLRAFRKDSILKLGLYTSGMEFASEMVVKALLFGMKITEIPYKLYPDGRDRPPHLRSIPDGLRHLEFLLIYSPKWLFAYPGIVLFAAGFLFMVRIYIQPLQIGRIQFEVTTMFYSAVIMLIGFHMLQFAVYTKMFAKRIGQLPGSFGMADRICAFLDRRGYGISLLVLLCGAAGAAFTLYLWKESGFGRLNTTWICRTAILFGSLFSLGTEGVLFTVFMKILRMGKTYHESE